MIGEHDVPEKKIGAPLLSSYVQLFRRYQEKRTESCRKSGIHKASILDVTAHAFCKLAWGFAAKWGCEKLPIGAWDFGLLLTLTPHPHHPAPHRCLLEANTVNPLGAAGRPDPNPWDTRGIQYLGFCCSTCASSLTLASWAVAEPPLMVPTGVRGPWPASRAPWPW